MNFKLRKKHSRDANKQSCLDEAANRLQELEIQLEWINGS